MRQPAELALQVENNPQRPRGWYVRVIGCGRRAVRSGSGLWGRFKPVGAAAVLVALVGAVPAAGRVGSAPPIRVLPAASGCTAGGTSPPGTGRGLEPNQLAAAYDIPSKWQAGYPGHQPTVALLEVGQALDQTRWDQFSAC